MILNKGFGLVTNIGIHFFDMLHYIFGKLINYEFIKVNKIARQVTWNLKEQNFHGFYQLMKKIPQEI